MQSISTEKTGQARFARVPRLAAVKGSRFGNSERRRG
jgi:hypothetical protein